MHVRLVHWDPAGARRGAELLRALGHEVDARRLEPSKLRALTREPPDALVVDLSRLPGQGRDVAVFFRRSRLGRGVPIVFVDGEPGKVERARAVLPDAQFTGWSTIGAALEAARERPATAPVVPDSALAAYAGTPVPQKLGIKDGFRVRALAAPPELERLLAPLPDGATLGAPTRSPDLVLCFLRSRNELEKLWPRATSPGVPLWLFWTKRAASPAADLDQRTIRAYGLERGWVDHKIARLDATWAGLRFVERSNSDS